MGPCVFSNTSSVGKGNSHRWKASKPPVAVLLNRGIFADFFPMYVLYSTLLDLPPPSEDAGIEPRTVALITRLGLIPARLDLIPTSDRSHPPVVLVVWLAILLIYPNIPKLNTSCEEI